MFDHRCQVLLIEDDSEDREKIRYLLANAKSALFTQGFEVVEADTFAAGQEHLANASFDVVLLDLMLPDSRGADTLMEIQKIAAGIPIIVQTMLEDEAIAVKALDLGACGYLPKTKLDTNLLVYAIRAAIERRIQLAALEPQQGQELAMLESIMGSTGLESSLLGLDPLRQRIPDVFTELKERYEQLLEQALEQQIYKVEYKLAPALEVLAEQLGFLKATPRDLIELHTQILRQVTKGVKLRKAQAYTEEGRFLLLELMGKLTSYYRRYYVGLSKINLAKSYNDLLPADD